MKVKDAMHRYAFSVHPNTSVSEIAENMRVHDVGAIPITENGKVVGIVTDRDIVVRALLNGHSPSQLKARDIMTKRVLISRENEKLETAVQIMETNKVRRLPVLDSNNTLTGMLSLGDVAHVGSSKLIAGALMSVAEHHGKNNKVRY
jgi:CBS domain-containing protein